MQPVYHNPLSVEELQQLGRLSVAWSEMDYRLLEAIAKLLGISLAHCEVVFARSPTGPRRAAFKHFASTLADAEARRLAKEFCRRSEGIIASRNHLTHGLWGLFAPKGGAPYKAACYHPQNKTGLIFAAELGSLTDKAIEVSNLLYRFINLPYPQFLELRDRHLYMGYGPPEGHYAAPEGSEYLDLATLGHIARPSPKEPDSRV